MKSGDEIHELNYELIKRAVSGETDALEEILRIYEPYHNAICSRKALSADGRLRRVLDEDKKVRVQMHLVKAIQTKWRELI